MKCIVCVKQVPDTSGVVAVKEDGTMDRAAMATITNHDDLAAVEAALRIKDATGCKVVVVSMGPPPAEGMLRELLAMGCDEAVLVSAREFGGSDTYATSQILAAAIKKVGVDEDDIVFCGRQAIDGDTAQVGPQVAEKLNWPQVTYAEEIVGIEGDELLIRRRLEHGVETVACRLPLVMTVNGTAPECRPRHAKLVMKYKHAITPSECQLDQVGCYAQLRESRPYLNITEWGVADVDADDTQLGLSGSPTKV